MKSGTVLIIVACCAIAILAFVARSWRSDVSSDAPTSVARTGTVERRASNEHGNPDARDERAGRYGAEGSRHAKADGFANANQTGSERGASGDAAGDRRDGASALVRGAAREGGGGTAVGAAPDKLNAGAASLGQALGATKREVPDMPKQPASAAMMTGEPGDNAPAPEPAPEVAYDGGADHVFSTKSQVQVPDAANITGDAGTVSFWVKPGWGPTSQDDATFVQLGDSSLQVVKNVDFLRFEYLDSNGTENGLGTNIDNWQQDQWRQVTATWTGGNLALYVDGQLISQNRYQNPPTFGEETKLLVGSDFSGPVAPGQVSNLTVLNRNSSPTEIAQQFQSGARPTN